MIKKNPELSDYLQDLLGEQLDKFLNAPAELQTIRINELKTFPDLDQDFIQKGFEFEKIKWAKNSYFIKKQSFSLSQTLHYFLGQIIFQGASSQLPAIILNAKPACTMT